MKLRHRISRVIEPGGDYKIHVIGDQPTPLRDFYHALLRLPWWVTIATISASFLAANALFAGAFLWLAPDGIANARPAAFGDAFFFSVQTMGTIGYGAMYPRTTPANLLVVAEAIVSVLLTALSTGLVFSKFSRSTARLVFMRRATISPVDGVPTLVFRIGNLRGNQIVDARLRLVMVRTERSAEGRTFYRMLDLKLQRDQALTLARSWSLMHLIDRDSPLFGETPASLAAKEVELQVLVVGLDDTFMQSVHGQHRYFASEIAWGARPIDVLTETPDGDIVLDLRKFHDIEPTAPTDTFPYPPPPPASRE